MGLRMRTNVASLNAQRMLSKSTDTLRASAEKLASGERINKAADDAAGLAISEKMRSDIRGLGQARRNAQDGVSLVQTAEGGLEETANMLVRLRELSVQAASDTIGQKERGYLNEEFMALKDEIDRIATSVEFNGTRLLTGNADVSEDLKSNANGFPMEIQVSKDYFQSVDGLDQRNPTDIIRIDLGKLNAFTDGEGSLGLGRNTEGTKVSDKQSAQMSIQVIDDASSKVNSYRAYLGSIQNRLTSTLNNLGVQIDNLSEARSRIRDTDFADETAKMTQANIMQQAGSSVLAQANAMPQIALSLLKG
jgi:flagellin